MAGPGRGFSRRGMGQAGWTAGELTECDCPAPSNGSVATLSSMADSLHSPEEKARLYLKKHRIMEMLNYLTFQLLYHRPDKPREFLQDMLSRIKIAKITSVDFPYLIDDSNLVSMFEIMDPTNQGFITPVQYKEALKNLGLLDSDEVIDENLEVITKDYFRKDVARKTLKMWLSF